MKNYKSYFTLYLANLEYPFFGNLNFPTLLVYFIYFY